MILHPLLLLLEHLTAAAVASLTIATLQIVSILQSHSSLFYQHHHQKVPMVSSSSSCCFGQALYDQAINGSYYRGQSLQLPPLVHHSRHYGFDGIAPRSITVPATVAPLQGRVHVWLRGHPYPFHSTFSLIVSSPLLQKECSLLGHQAPYLHHITSWNSHEATFLFYIL